jgi:type II restriction enzyme
LCPKCKRTSTLKKLPKNFKCADLICDFCGYLAQVKTVNHKSIDELPKSILGAAWQPQKERMDAGIYFPLFLVVKAEQSHAIYYLPTDLQQPALFLPRKPLSDSARRAGWQGFKYNLEVLSKGAFVRLL